jgi:hypothetical protein
MTLKIEVRQSARRTLLVVVHFLADSNLWINNGEVSYVPRRAEIELIRESLDAIDNHNVENMLKRNFGKQL